VFLICTLIENNVRYVKCIVDHSTFKKRSERELLRAVKFSYVTLALKVLLNQPVAYTDASVN